MVLNQRSCMLVVLRIIEENIPEVRTGDGGGGLLLLLCCRRGFSSRSAPSLQLQSLNLSSNKLYRLDDLAELAQKAAGLKILDLSRNEVGAAPRPLHAPLFAPSPPPPSSPCRAAAEIGTGPGQSEGAQAGRALAGRQPPVRRFPGPGYLRQVSVSLGAALGARGPPLLGGGQDGRMKRGRPPPPFPVLAGAQTPPQKLPHSPWSWCGTVKGFSKQRRCFSWSEISFFSPSSSSLYPPPCPRGTQPLLRSPPAACLPLPPPLCRADGGSRCSSTLPWTISGVGGGRGLWPRGTAFAAPVLPPSPGGAAAAPRTHVWPSTMAG